MLTISKTHKKTYVHKNFKNNNQSNELFFTEIKNNNDFKSKFIQDTNQKFE